MIVAIDAGLQPAGADAPAELRMPVISGLFAATSTMMLLLVVARSLGRMSARPVLARNADRHSRLRGLAAAGLPSSKGMTLLDYSWSASRRDRAIAGLNTRVQRHFPQMLRGPDTTSGRVISASGNPADAQNRRHSRNSRIAIAMIGRSE